ncbi:MAG: hypothetical protein ACXVA9_02675, partial [Bdellovibrionales bacterium]
PYCLRDRGQYGYGRNSTPNVPISAQVAAGLVEQVERKKKEIIATFELKNWEDPQNVFKDKMSNLESLKSCDKKNCVGQLKLIQEFLKDDLSQYNGYHGYTNFMAKYGYGINVGTSEQNSKSDKELWLEFFASVEKACTPLFKASPLSRTAWEDLRDRVELNDPEKKVQAFAISETRVQESCDLITKAIDKVPIPATEAGYCSGCQIQATFKSGSSSYGTQMSKSVVQAMLKTPQDYADFFNGALEGIQYNMGPQNNYTGKKCKYDPLQSAKRIEAILKLDCVDAVFVPDMYLVNSMRQYKGRVFYRPFDSDDRFAYSIKNSCPGGRK